MFVPIPSCAALVRYLSMPNSLIEQAVVGIPGLFTYLIDIDVSTKPLCTKRSFFFYCKLSRLLELEMIQKIIRNNHKQQSL